MQASTHSVQRSFNRSVVLRTIKNQARISRVDLARKLGLEKSTISTIVNELMDRGLVLQKDGGSIPGVGRKPVYLELNKSFCCFLGIEIQPSRYRAVILNLKGEIVSRFAGRAAVYNDGIEATLAHIYENLIPNVESLSMPLAAIGIGIPGYINPHNGVVIESIPFDLHDRCLASIPNPWDVPTFVENDANCCAWAEMLTPCAENGSDFLAMLIEFQEKNPLIKQEAGISIGLGLVANSSLYYGESFMAGEFHSLFWKKGNKSQTGISDERLAKVKDDPAIFDDVLEEVLLNLTPLVSVLAPSRIVLCGDAAKAMTRIQDLIATKLSATWLADPANADLFGISRHEYDVSAIGAAGRMIVNLFEKAGGLGITADGRNTGSFDWSYLLDRFGHEIDYSAGAA